jgi:hypothetical protein
MFEAKGVAGAAERLTLVVGDVRQPFPQQAQQAQVRLPPHCTDASKRIYAPVESNIIPQYNA